MKDQDKKILLNQALNFHHSGDLDKANTLYLKVLSIDPEDFNANHLHGCILSQKKKYKDAVRFLTKSVELNSNDYEAINNLAIALKNEKDFVSLSETSEPSIRKGKSLIAALITLAFVISASVSGQPIFVVALLASIAMLATRCIDPSDAYNSVNWNIIFLII